MAARINNEGSVSVFEGDLRANRLEPNDLVLRWRRRLEEDRPNLVAALQYAKGVGARIAGHGTADQGIRPSTAEGLAHPARTLCRARALHSAVHTGCTARRAVGREDSRR
jgi:hypothetical protein